MNDLVICDHAGQNSDCGFGCMHGQPHQQYKESCYVRSTCLGTIVTCIPVKTEKGKEDVKAKIEELECKIHAGREIIKLAQEMGDDPLILRYEGIVEELEKEYDVVSSPLGTVTIHNITMYEWDRIKEIIGGIIADSCSIEDERNPILNKMIDNSVFFTNEKGE